MRRVRTRPVQILLLASVVMATGALSATSAAAEDPPSVTYLSTVGDNADRLFANDIGGVGTQTALSPTVHVDSYDVSEDGNTVVADVSTRAFTSDGWDTSWGVVLASRTAGTTRLIGTNYDSPVTLSADGRTAYWLSDGYLVRSVDGAIATRMATTNFVPQPGERAYALAITPDGTAGAVLFAGSANRRIVAGPLATTGGGWTQTWQINNPPYPISSTFTWLDNDQLLFSVGTTAEQLGTLVHQMSGGTSSSPLGAVYDVSHLGSTWYMWQDVGTTTNAGATSDASVAPTTWTPRTDSTTTYGYDIAAAVPPAITTAVNRAVTTPTLATSASAVRYGQRVYYQSCARYLIGYDYAAGYTYINCRGTLRYSIDRGVTWRNLATTSGATTRNWTTALRFSNGYTPLLRRNTWFRWTYPGDALTTAATSRIRLVTVTPILTVKVASSSGKRLVYGAATRNYGVGTLQKYSVATHRWSRIATVRLARTGAYSFGYRRLSHGTYRVVISKDYYWNMALKAFRL